jgi:trigger factor
VKSDVEELSPTRVRLTIEIEFDELKSQLEHAYREVGKQFRIPGFRPGKIPPRVIDQRGGRAAVLEHVVNDVVPEFYSKALEENEVFAISTPDYEVTKLDDGKELAFTAEVDIRPNFELPELNGLPVTVEDADVKPEQVEEYLNALRERFASLKGADRPVADGDFVSIDLSASVDGEPVEDAQASGISYEVGSASMLDGLDEALPGMSQGDTKTFTTELAGGKLAGQDADVTVTVHSVKVKELPELDDDFAQSASEFDTIGELREGTHEQLEMMQRGGQAQQARDRALDAVLEQIDIPLPENLLKQEIEMRRETLDTRLARAGRTRESYMDEAGLTEEGLEAEYEADAQRAVKAQFVLDKLAMQEKLGITQEELSQYLTEQAYRMGIQPEQLAKELTDRNQINAAVADVVRSKSLDILAQRADIKDESGRPVAVVARYGDPADGSAAEDGAVADGGDEDSAVTDSGDEDSDTE